MGETGEDLFLYYTQRAGEVCRHLCLAGIGVIWLLNPVTAGSLPNTLRWSLGLIVASLTIDILQYLAGTFMWYSEIGSSNRIKSCDWRIITLTAIVGVKLVCMLVGYISLGSHLYGLWF